MASTAAAAAVSGRSPSGRATSTARSPHATDSPYCILKNALEASSDHQRHGLAGGGIGERQRRLQARVGLRMAAEQLLDPGAGGGQLDLQVERVGGRDLEALEQRGVRLGEPADRGQRAGAAGQQPDALVPRRRLRQQPQRGGEPAGGAGRVALGHRLAGLAQHRDGLRVAVPAACSTWWARAGADAPRAASASAQRVVRAEPPAAGRRLVDRAAHERVAEAEAAWHVGGADEVAAQQLVERLHRRGLRDAGRCGGQLRARTGRRRRRRPRAPPAVAGQQRQLLAQRRARRRRARRRRPAESAPGGLAASRRCTRASCCR